ncbi:hypothetical protein AGIG_G22625 [Arapaima gigas]
MRHLESLIGKWTSLECRPSWSPAELPVLRKEAEGHVKDEICKAKKPPNGGGSGEGRTTAGVQQHAVIHRR